MGKTDHVPFWKYDRKQINNCENDFNYHLQNLSWKDSLDLLDESMINATIDSSGFERMKLGVMIPVMVHRFDWVNQSDSLWWWEPFRKFINGPSSMSDREYDKFLMHSINADTLSTKIKIQTTHYHSVDDDVFQALVIRQCKLLRKGLPTTVSIPPDWLNVYQKCQLHYSKFIEDVAIDSLLFEISLPYSLIRSEADALYITLLTYGSKGSHKSLAIVLDSTAFLSFPPYGRTYLLNYVTYRANLDFTLAEKSRFITYLNTESVFKGAMKGYITQIAFITSRLTGEDLKLCLNRVGLSYYEEENRILPMRRDEHKKE